MEENKLFDGTVERKGKITEMKGEGKEKGDKKVNNSRFKIKDKAK